MGSDPYGPQRSILSAPPVREDAGCSIAIAGSVSATGEEAKTIVGEVKAIQEKARRVLQAAAVEAYGRPGAYVPRDPVMRRASICELEEFWAVAEYLDKRGWIAEGDDDYGVFVVTAAGLDEATR